MRPATPASEPNSEHETALAPHIALVRLHAEAALVRRFNAGHGFADARIPAEIYLHDEATRERLGRDSLRPQDTHLVQAEEIAADIARARAALQGHASPLTAVAARFDLDTAEQALLAAAVAYELDHDVRELCQALAGRRRPALFGDVCQELMPVLAAPRTMLRVLHPSGPLRRGCLVDVDVPLGDPGRDRIDCALTVGRRVLDWLLGDPRIAEPLDAAVHILDATDDLHVHLDAGVIDQLTRVAARIRQHTAHGQPPLVLIQGAAGTGKQAAAHRLAVLLDRALAVAPLPQVLQVARRTRAPRLLRQVLGEARLRGAVPYLPGIELLHAGEADAAGGDIALEDIAQHGDIAILATREQGMPSLPLARPFLLVDLPSASLETRRRAWAHGLDALADVADPTLAGAADDLAARYVIGPGVVGEVVREARAFARAADARVGPGAIEQAVGRRLTMRLGPFGTRITRQARLEDMVLPADVREPIEQMISMVRERARILERWGYARHLGLSRGVSGLFSGDPGTGKTMAASVIAGALGLDLFRIDLSAVTSKWVGETEKHLARIFDEAQNANAMLLFDEADSLFGKRTELKSAQDRYANLEVNYVLQRMETFDGVSVLTTNLESAIDQAFLRRLNFRIRFPAPEEDERAELWRRLLPPETGLGNQVDVRSLAGRFVMTGGHIRNAIVRAAVIAARDGRDMTERDLLAGAHHEYIELGKVMPSLLD